MRVIIAGCRKGVTYEHVAAAMAQCGWLPSEVVTGKANGADAHGETWAKKNLVPIKEFPADWKDLSHPDARIKVGPYGKYDAYAGIRRNHDMGDYAQALVAIWDGISRGTKDMIEYATKKGLKVFVFRIDKL